MVCNINYKSFYESLFYRIDQIYPEHLFLEVFKSNKEIFLKECCKRYRYINIYNSMYYNNQKNKCWIIHASNMNIKYPLNNMDEEKIIEWICKNHNYRCIGDLCMGKGLVGWYAFKYKKQFVGIELNKKRLAILIEKIKNEMGTI